MGSILLSSLLHRTNVGNHWGNKLGKFRGNGRNNWYVSDGDEAYMIGQIRREIESAQPKTIDQMESERRGRLVRDSKTRTSNRHWAAFGISILFWPSLILWIQPMGNLWGPFLVGLAQWFVIDLVWCWLGRQKDAANMRREEVAMKRAARPRRPSRRS